MQNPGFDIFFCFIGGCGCTSLRLWEGAIVHTTWIIMGFFYRWALKGESVIINMSHWYLRKACNTHAHTKPRLHAGDLNYLKPLIVGPHTQTHRVDAAVS